MGDQQLPRINIDDELRSDPRFHSLCNNTSRVVAIGSIFCLWELGQAYWKKNESLIPIGLAEQLPNYSDLVRVGFAIPKDDGVYCCGAKERWGFLIARSEAGKAGGLKSAQVRLEKYGTSIPNNASNLQSEAKTEAKPSKPKPSSSSSSSSSKYNTTTAKKVLPFNGGERPVDPEVDRLTAPHPTNPLSPEIRKRIAELTKSDDPGVIS